MSYAKLLTGNGKSCIECVSYRAYADVTDECAHQSKGRIQCGICRNADDYCGRDGRWFQKDERVSERELYIRRYVLVSGMKRWEYDRDFVALRCQCSDGCPGWASIANDPELIADHVENHSQAEM